MAIIFSDELANIIETQLSNSKDSIQIISAFCKKDALMYLDKNISSTVTSKKIMVRFRLDDLIAGVTDFGIYEYCKSHNWKLYIHLDLHAKTYIFDNLRCIVGSANVTNKGLGLAINHNIEASALFALDNEDILKINHLFDLATEMDEHIYTLMKKELKNISLSKKITNVWSLEIMNEVKKQLTPLFPQQFPKSEEVSLQTASDFLETPGLTKENIATFFKNSNPYLWLKNELTKKGEPIYFGELTALLHDALVKDPKPYRKDVKDYLHYLLVWCEKLASDEIIIDRPSHSQRIQLIKN